MMQCKAKSVRSKQRCRRAAMKGREVCYNHGGKSLRGAASPLYKTGEHSRWDKLLPARLADKFEQCVADPKLMSLYREIGLVRAREIELLGRLDAGESGALWAALGREWAAFQKAWMAGDRKGMEDTLPAIGNMIERGAGEAGKWAELMNVQDHMRKLTESEAKIRLSAAKVVTLAELYNIMAAFRSVVIREVHDKGQAQAVIDGVRAVIVENNLLGDADADSD